MPTPDDSYAQAVVETVQEMTRRLDEHTRTGEESRTKLQETVEALVAGMRQDVHRSIAEIRIDNADHKAAHEADRIERITRQQQVDASFAEVRQQTSAQTTEVQQQVTAGLMEIRQYVERGLAEIRKWLIVGLVGVAFAAGFTLAIWLF